MQLIGNEFNPSLEKSRRQATHHVVFSRISTGAMRNFSDCGCPTHKPRIESNRAHVLSFNSVHKTDPHYRPHEWSIRNTCLDKTVFARANEQVS